MTAAATASGSGIFRFGLLAYLGAGISLVFCFWKATFGLVAPLLGITITDINPHLQAAMMWLFAGGTVLAIMGDRRRHKSSLPLVVAVLALAVIIGTLYTFYHDAILAAGYVLLLVAAFLNQNRMLASLNRKIARQADELAALNRGLEERVGHQVAEIEKLARLRRFLPPEIADRITEQGREALLDSHRRYISCLFCDLRGFTSMTERMEPEDVMAVLRDFHETVGRLVVGYRGTIGYRAGDGVLVFFNDPIPCDDPDLRAASLALDLHHEFAGLRDRWAKLDADVGLGIGIAGGHATMGLIGVEGRVDYTPIGNVVNLAARLCDHARDGQILINRRSRGEIESKIVTRDAGSLTLKGVSQPVEIFMLEALADGVGRPVDGE